MSAARTTSDVNSAKPSPGALLVSARPIKIYNLWLVHSMATHTNDRASCHGIHCTSRVLDVRKVRAANTFSHLQMI